MAGKKRTKKRLEARPACTCLLLCDDVVVSHARGKHRLEGVIGAMAVRREAPVAGPFVVYGHISNVHLDQSISVSFEHADSGHVLWSFKAQFVNRNDPLAVHMIIAQVPPFPVAQGGRHLLKAAFDGYPLAQVPVQVILAEGSGESGR